MRAAARPRWPAHRGPAPGVAGVHVAPPSLVSNTRPSSAVTRAAWLPVADTANQRRRAGTRHRGPLARDGEPQHEPALAHGPGAVDRRRRAGRAADRRGPCSARSMSLPPSLDDSRRRPSAMRHRNRPPGSANEGSGRMLRPPTIAERGRLGRFVLQPRLPSRSAPAACRRSGAAERLCGARRRADVMVTVSVTPGGSSLARRRRVSAAAASAGAGGAAGAAAGGGGRRGARAPQPAPPGRTCWLLVCWLRPAAAACWLACWLGTRPARPRPTCGRVGLQLDVACVARRRRGHRPGCFASAAAKSAWLNVLSASLRASGFALSCSSRAAALPPAVGGASARSLD